MNSSTLPVIIVLVWLIVAAAAAYFVPSVRRVARILLARRAFLVALVVLSIAALSLNGAVGALRLHFKKRAVPLAVRSLTDPADGIPEQIGSWVQVSKDEGIDSETQQVLGTAQYCFRDYVDSRVWPADQIERIKEKSDKQREMELLRLQVAQPQSVIRAAVTYYTGMADTVAHIPERCYVADGFEPSGSQTRGIVCGTYPDGKPRELEFRFITFEDQTGRGRVARNVAYLFHVDGVYTPNSGDVRWRLQNLFEPYGYYAKVELMTSTPNGRAASPENEQSVTAMTDFLTSLLPELERCLPDWKKLHATPSALASGKLAAAPSDR